MRRYASLISAISFLVISGSGFAEETLPFQLPELDQPTTVPQEPTTEHFFMEFLHMLAMLGILLGLILAVSWVLKRILNTRMEQINQSSPIKILERRSLTPKTAIFVVDVYGKKCIVADSQNGVTYLGDLPSGIVIADDEPNPPPQRPFSDFLKK